MSCGPTQKNAQRLETLAKTIRETRHRLRREIVDFAPDLYGEVEGASYLKEFTIWELLGEVAYWKAVAIVLNSKLQSLDRMQFLALASTFRNQVGYLSIIRYQFT